MPGHGGRLGARRIAAQHAEKRLGKALGTEGSRRQHAVGEHPGLLVPELAQRSLPGIGAPAHPRGRGRVAEFAGHAAEQSFGHEQEAVPVNGLDLAVKGVDGGAVRRIGDKPRGVVGQLGPVVRHKEPFLARLPVRGEIIGMAQHRPEAFP